MGPGQLDVDQAQVQSVWTGPSLYGLDPVCVDWAQSVFSILWAQTYSVSTNFEPTLWPVWTDYGYNNLCGRLWV